MKITTFPLAFKQDVGVHNIRGVIESVAAFFITGRFRYLLEKNVHNREEYT